MVGVAALLLAAVRGSSMQTSIAPENERLRSSQEHKPLALVSFLLLWANFLHHLNFPRHHFRFSNCRAWCTQKISTHLQRSTAGLLIGFRGVQIFIDRMQREAEAWKMHFFGVVTANTLAPKERYDESLSGPGTITQPSNWEAGTLTLS